MNNKKKLDLKKIGISKLNTIKGGNFNLNDYSKETCPAICDYEKSFLPEQCNYVGLGE